MKKILTLLLTAGLASSSFAGMRSFKDAKGRVIEAEIVFTVNDMVTIKRRDGKKFTVPISTFSESDQTFIAEWAKKNEEEIARLKAVTDVQKKRLKVSDYCVSMKGRQVGNGECWTLADEAYKSCKAKRPDGQGRVWGRLVDHKNESIEPGDIIEFRTAKISGYGTTGPAHTAVAIKSGRRMSCTIAEQNFNNIKKVRFVELDLGNLESGEVMVYRLEK